MSFELRSDVDFDALAARVEADAPEMCEQALREHVLPRSLEMVPKETGDLAGSAELRRVEGGADIVYTSVYARYIHEHLGFKHPAGGTAKFLEVPFIEGEGAVLNSLSDQIGALL